MECSSLGTDKEKKNMLFVMKLELGKTDCVTVLQYKVFAFYTESLSISETN